MCVLGEELSELPARLASVPHTELITCHPSMVQIKVRMTAHKMMMLYIQFPPDYPKNRLIIELKSKTIPEKFLEGLVNVCDKEMSRHVGKKQVMEAVNFVCDFIRSNPFIVCSEELSHIKKELVREGDELKVKQKAGSLQYTAYQQKYRISFVLNVPHEYPFKHIEFELKDSNFPTALLQVFKGHISEISRQCVEPPLRRKPSDPPFQPKPSLQLVADYIIKDCVRKYPLEKCPCCHEKVLPDDPKDVISDESHPKFMYRMYCDHCYHNGCLETYTKTPPFTGGKKCLACNQRLSHDKWNVRPKLAEDRWAHQEARKREIAEVADFLGV